MYARDDLAGRLPDQTHVAAAAVMLHLLADPTRLRLMWLLTAGEHDVTALTEAVGVARPAVSQHLAKLRLAGLVTVRRQGRHAVYAVSGGHVRRLVTEALYAAEHHVSGVPDHDGRAEPTRSRVAEGDNSGGHREDYPGVGGEHAEAGPRTDRKVGEVPGRLDGESGAHR
jgi:DNA-binding transcriptional ArsR family regulator